MSVSGTPPKRFCPMTPTKSSVQSPLKKIASSSPTKTSQPTTPQNTPPKDYNKSPGKYSIKSSPFKDNIKKGSPVKNLTYNTSNEDVYSEGLISYLLASPLAQFPWLNNLKDVKSIPDAFRSLEKTDQRLYARLFARQHGWIRNKRINYNFVRDLRTSIENLQLQGFVTTDYSKEDIKVILEMLEKDEVKTICKDQKVDSKGNKSEMIELLIKRCKTQKTIMSMFGGAAGSQAIIMKSVKKVLECVKLTDGPRDYFKILLVLVTYPHYRGEESRRVSELAKTLYEKGRGLVLYHKYNLRPIDVFKNIARFKEFEESIHAVENFLALKESKKWNEATEMIKQSKIDFLLFIKNELNIQHLNELKDADMDYLMKFTAGRNYAYILSKGIEILKKDSINYGEAIEVLKMLLEQQYFLRGAKGHWYRELALIYEKMHNFESMVDTLIEGLTDAKLITCYSIVNLIQKAESMGKRKALSSVHRNKLMGSIPSCNYSANTIEITATSAPSVTTSKKQMFVKTTESGKEYSIVEEVARSHYEKELGFKSGIHDEGKLIVHCSLACFWEVIFCDIEGVFHSELQSAPLDWGTSGFYKRRIEAFEEITQEIESRGAELSLEYSVNKYKGVVGPVDWQLMDAQFLSDAQSFLRCLKTDVFIKIAKYLLEDFRSRRSGLPDLTLWDASTGKCRFVEVKGPTDTLSPNQIKWLEKLNEFGASAEVCRVNTLNSGPGVKSSKRKYEEAKGSKE